MIDLPWLNEHRPTCHARWADQHLWGWARRTPWRWRRADQPLKRRNQKEKAELQKYGREKGTAGWADQPLKRENWKEKAELQKFSGEKVTLRKREKVTMGGPYVADREPGGKRVAAGYGEGKGTHESRGKGVQRKFHRGNMEEQGEEPGWKRTEEELKCIKVSKREYEEGMEGHSRAETLEVGPRKGHADYRSEPSSRRATVWWNREEARRKMGKNRMPKEGTRRIEERESALKEVYDREGG